MFWGVIYPMMDEYVLFRNKEPLTWMDKNMTATLQPYALDDVWFTL